MQVLIADDDPTIRVQLRLLLTKWGYGVVECSDGLEAWEAAQAEDAPSMLLLDWSIPGMEGIEICKRVRKLDKKKYSYIILLTGKAEKKDVIKGFEVGADDYVTKPFFPHELQARLKAGIRVIGLQRQLMDARAILETEAVHDSLTGTLNRRGIKKATEAEFERASRSKSELAVAMFDLDNFKLVNDTYGHMAGDTLLQEVTKKIRSILRPYDIFGRFGGDEFLLVMPGCSKDDAVKLCNRIRGAIFEYLVPTVEGAIKVSLSIGVCVRNASEQPNVDSLIKSADKALYQAKGNGRNRVEIAAD